MKGRTFNLERVYVGELLRSRRRRDGENLLMLPQNEVRNKWTDHERKRDINRQDRSGGWRVDGKINWREMKKSAFPAYQERLNFDKRSFADMNRGIRVPFGSDKVAPLSQNTISFRRRALPLPRRKTSEFSDNSSRRETMSVPSSIHTKVERSRHFEKRYQKREVHHHHERQHNGKDIVAKREKKTTSYGEKLSNFEMNSLSYSMHNKSFSDKLNKNSIPYSRKNSKFGRHVPITKELQRPHNRKIAKIVRNTNSQSALFPKYIVACTPEERERQRKERKESELKYKSRQEALSQQQRTIHTPGNDWTSERSDALQLNRHRGYNATNNYRFKNSKETTIDKDERDNFFVFRLEENALISPRSPSSSPVWMKRFGKSRSLMRNTNANGRGDNVLLSKMTAAAKSLLHSNNSSRTSTDSFDEDFGLSSW